MLGLLAVVEAVGGSVLSSLIKGLRPGEDEWAGLATSLLRAVMDQQRVTDATLARIEEKVDNLAVQPYRGAIGTGMRLLEGASASWRDAADRERLLFEARTRFTEATQLAPDALAKVHAESLLAICWLLVPSPRDTLSTLEYAASFAWDEAVQLSSWSPKYPELDERAKKYLAGGERLSAMMGLATPEAYSRAHRDIYNECLDRIRPLLDAFNEIQGFLGYLNTDSGSYPIVQFDFDRLRTLEPLMKWHPHVVMAYGMTTTWRGFRLCWNEGRTSHTEGDLVVVDARINIAVLDCADRSISFMGWGPPDSVTAGAPLPRISQTDARKRSEAMSNAPALASPWFAVDPTTFGSWIRVPAGNDYEGWLRTACPERPKTLVVVVGAFDESEKQPEPPWDTLYSPHDRISPRFVLHL